MFTSFDQVKDWIIDNGFKRWVLYRDRSKTEKIIDSASFTVSDMDDKIAMTEKYLRMAGGSAYAAGGTTNSKDDLATVAEIRLESAQAPAAGIGIMQPAIDEDKIAQRIEAKLRAEYEKKEYERKREELDKERKAFEEEKNSAMGAIAHYFAPIGRAMLEQHRMVAGVDATAPIQAQPIRPIDPNKEQELVDAADEPFTDEEADELYKLLAEFKQVEPDYMKMLRKVVEMAKAQDATYTMAKQFLCQ